MIIHFPAMHPGFLAGPAPESGLFFDPGLEDELVERAFRPQGLPLTPAKARRLLADSQQFGEQFKAPGDMVAQAMFQEAEDSEHTWTIRAEFEQRLAMDAASPEAATADAGDDAADAAQAQFLLLLALATQAHSLELREINQDLGQAWEKFGDELGLDADEDADEAVQSLSRTLSDTSTLDDTPEPLPWPWLLGAMAAYLEEGTILAASDADTVAAWADLELDFAPADASLGLPAGWIAATAPAWKLAGRRRAPAGAHWNKPLTAAMPAIKATE